MIGNSDGRWGKARLPIPADCCVCLVVVPTVTLAVSQSMLTTGASVAKDMYVAPESRITLAFYGSSRCWRVFLA